MIGDLPQAHLVSDIPGRARLRLPAYRGDAAFFAALASRLLENPAVRAAHPNAATAGMLILYAGTFEELLRNAERRSLFILRAGAARRPSIDASRQWPLFAAGGMALLGGLQLVRGQALPPALTLFWNAATLIAMRHNN